MSLARIAFILLILATGLAWSDSASEAVAAYSPLLKPEQTTAILHQGWGAAPPSALLHLDRNHRALDRAFASRGNPPESDLDRWVEVTKSLAVRGLFRADHQEARGLDDILKTLEIGQRLRKEHPDPVKRAGFEILQHGLRAYATWLDQNLQSEEELERSLKSLNRVSPSKAPVTLSLAHDLAEERKRLNDVCQSPRGASGPEALLVRMRSSKRQEVMREFGNLSVEYLSVARRQLQQPGSRAVKRFFDGLSQDHPKSRVVMPTPAQLAKAIALKRFPRVEELIHEQLVTDGYWTACRFLTRTRQAMLSQGRNWSPSLLEAPLDPLGRRMRLAFEGDTLRLSTSGGDEFLLRLPPIPLEVNHEQES